MIWVVVVLSYLNNPEKQNFKLKRLPGEINVHQIL